MSSTDEAAFNQRKQIYRTKLIPIKDKNNVLMRAQFAQDYDEAEINKYCASASNKEGNADFLIIAMIRLLYNPELPSAHKENIKNALSNFPFWPHNETDGKNMKKIVFFSENHAFMLLSSAYLYRQYMLTHEPDRAILPTELEYQLLLCYLRAHINVPHRGVYEVLSFVYLPYTLCAMFNLIDFARDAEVVSLARELAELVIVQMMRVTTADGVCSLTVAARTYKRFRLRTFNHNVNHFVYLMTGKHPDKKHWSYGTGSGAGSDGVAAAAGHEEVEEDHEENKVAAATAGSLAGTGGGDAPAVVDYHEDDTSEHVVVPPTRAGGAAAAGEPHEEDYLGMSTLGDFASVTSYVPSAACFAAHHEQGALNGTPMNPSVEELADFYGTYVPSADLSVAAAEWNAARKAAYEERNSAGNSEAAGAAPVYIAPVPAANFTMELTPFYWSAGLLVHPSFAEITKVYVTKRYLNKNVHLWPIARLPSWAVGSLSLSNSLWTSGQCYVGITMNTYKHENLLLASFEKFNPGTCGYQQMPWMANLDGVGVWTQAGSGSENIGGFDVTNTHTPSVSQKGHVLVSVYSTPEVMQSHMTLAGLMDSSARLFWPAGCLFTDEDRQGKVAPKSKSTFPIVGALIGRAIGGDENVKEKTEAGSWWFGERSHEYLIGVYCTAATKVFHQKVMPDATIEINKNKKIKIKLLNRVCKKTRHAWVCVVGRLLPKGVHARAAAVAAAAEDPSLVYFTSFEHFKTYCRQGITVEQREQDATSSAVPYKVFVTVDPVRIPVSSGAGDSSVSTRGFMLEVDNPTKQ